MKRLLIGLLMLSLCAFSADFTISHLGLSATIKTKGGQAASLKLGGRELLSPVESGFGSFTEQAFSADGDRVLLEPFGLYEFEAVSHTADSVTMTAVGTCSFDWLRVTRTFRLDGSRNVLKVSYILSNISDKEHSVGLWSKAFVRDTTDAKNIFSYPSKDGVKEIPNPGPGGEVFTHEPMQSWVAFRGASSDFGGIITLPRQLLTAFYGFFSATSDVATTEWFLRESAIPPKGDFTFDIEVRLSNAVSKELTRTEYQSMTVTAGAGVASRLPAYYDHKDKAVKVIRSKEGVMPRSSRNVDITGLRQYNDSTRGILVPAKEDISHVAVFEVANKAIQHDRPVDYQIETLPNGDHRILVRVPGINHRGYYFCTFKDGYCYDGKQFKGLDGFTYRVCLDMPGQKESSLPIFANGANLFCNPTFERKAADKEWPDGCFWSSMVNPQRHLYEWVNEGPDGSKCMKIVRHKDSVHYSSVGFYFRLEDGVKYTCSADTKCENMDHNNAVVGVFFFNDERKEPPSLRKFAKWMPGLKDSHDWKNYSVSFFKPSAEAVFGHFSFAISTVNQTRWFDNLKVVPADFTYETKSAKDILLAEVKESHYPALDFFENLSHEVVTPHVKWLKKPVDAVPDILYLPLATTRGIQHMERRQIVEFAQRMKLTYTYYPLLPLVESEPDSWDMKFGKGFEPYTTYQLNQLEKIPKVVIVQAIHFKQRNDQAFMDALNKYRKQGSNFLFYNCTDIPEELLGERIEDPQEVFTTPSFRRVGKDMHERAFKAYRNGSTKVICMTRNADEWYLNPWFYACVPPEKAREHSPAYYSYDFPYWEYIYLSVLKSIRYLADIEPVVKVVANNQQKGSITVQAKQATAAVLKAVYYDLHRGAEGESSQKLQLQTGANDIALQLPELPGGDHVANYWLLDDAGNEYDCGAILLKTPVRHAINVTFADKDRIFKRGETVSAKVSIADCPQGATLSYTVEDTEKRIVVQHTMTASATQSISFAIAPPYTTLYYLRLQLKVDGKAVSTAFEEFSLPTTKDLTQLDALIWLGHAALLKPAKDLGFTMWITNLVQDSYGMGRMNALRSVDMIPLGYGLGSYDYTKTALQYRGDIVSDPVRTPCFSDPAYQKGAAEYVTKRCEVNHARYYGVENFEIADEAFLGSSVCYSEHCLRDFRKELEAAYGSLEALNREWETTFASWNEVMPCQLKEVQGKPNLSRWLDHKMFMAHVFAQNWLGNTTTALKACVPGAKVGLSGTQVPGYSYDWVQLMKVIECLSYYGGIQRKAVHDFAKPGFVSGQWAGGYAVPYIDDEFYQKNNIWNDMMLGANMVSNFAGRCFNGDLKPVQNTLFYSELVQELRRGPARLMLSSDEILRDVAILYSQASLYAAMGSIGGAVWHNSQTGWAALVGDLQCSYRYVSYEDLDAGRIGARLLVLPAAVALSDKAVEQLDSYVKNGGTVVADFAPGWYDQHGKTRRHQRLEALFGIRRDAAAISMATAEAEVTANAQLGISSVKGQMLLGESGLTLDGGVACGKAADGSPICIVNRVGKGRTVLLNNLVTTYQQIGLSGVGGEVQKVETGSGLFCENMRTLLNGLFKASGVRSNSRIVMAQGGKDLPCLSTLHQDGDNYVYGILLSSGGRYAKGANGYLLFKDFPKVAVRATLPVSGHIYDVRRGLYVGEGDSFDMKLIAGDGQIYAVLKDKVTSVDVSLPDTVTVGQTIAVSCSAAGGSSAHVFQLDLVAPDGAIAAPYSQNAHFEAPKGEFRLQVPYNAARGRWLARVRDVNTGIVGTKIFEVQ